VQQSAAHAARGARSALCPTHASLRAALALTALTRAQAPRLASRAAASRKTRAQQQRRRLLPFPLLRVLLMLLRKRPPVRLPVRMPQQRHRHLRCLLLRVVARREWQRLLWQRCHQALAPQSRTHVRLCPHAAARRELRGRRQLPHLQSWRRAASRVSDWWVQARGARPMPCAPRGGLTSAASCPLRFRSAPGRPGMARRRSWTAGARTQRPVAAAGAQSRETPRRQTQFAARSVCLRVTFIPLRRATASGG
jgi:hypothetical protein